MITFAVFNEKLNNRCQFYFLEENKTGWDEESKKEENRSSKLVNGQFYFYLL